VCSSNTLTLKLLFDMCCVPFPTAGSLADPYTIHAEHQWVTQKHVMVFGSNCWCLMLLICYQEVKIMWTIIDLLCR